MYIYICICAKAQGEDYLETVSNKLIVIRESMALMWGGGQGGGEKEVGKGGIEENQGAGHLTLAPAVRQRVWVSYSIQCVSSRAVRWLGFLLMKLADCGVVMELRGPSGGRDLQSTKEPC